MESELIPGSHAYRRHLMHLLGLLRRKWEPYVFSVLLERPMRYIELRERIRELQAEDGKQPISDKVLSDMLDAMKANGLVAHRASDGDPDAPHYGLTAKAVELLHALGDSVSWDATHYESGEGDQEQ